MSVQIEVLTRENCHLCAEAKTIVADVVATAQKAGVDVLLHETDVDANPELLSLYGEEVPVVFINGRQHTYWKVDADRLATCISNAAAAVPAAE